MFIQCVLIILEVVNRLCNEIKGFPVMVSIVKPPHSQPTMY